MLWKRIRDVIRDADRRWIKKSWNEPLVWGIEKGLMQTSLTSNYIAILIFKKTISFVDIAERMITHPETADFFKICHFSANDHVIFGVSHPFLGVTR